MVIVSEPASDIQSSDLFYCERSVLQNSRIDHGVHRRSRGSTVSLYLWCKINVCTICRHFMPTGLDCTSQIAYTLENE